MDLVITLWVNGTARQLSVDTRTTLLDALRPRDAQRTKVGKERWLVVPLEETLSR